MNTTCLQLDEEQSHVHMFPFLYDLQHLLTCICIYKLAVQTGKQPDGRLMCAPAIITL